MKGLSELLRRAEAAFAGDETVLSRELSVMYPASELEEEVSRYRKRIIRQYAAVLLAAVLACCAAASFALYSRTSLKEILRPEAGEANQSVPVRVEAEYDGQSVRKETTLRISSAERTEQEKKTALEKFAKKLPDEVIPLRDGRRVVSGDLELPESDAETGISIRWSSGLPEVIDERGRVDVTEIKGTDALVTLTAELRLDECSMETDIPVLVVKDEKLYSTALNRELDDLIETISTDGEGESVVLPDKTDSGVKLKWETGGGPSAPLILILGIIGILFIYNGRYSRAKKAARAYREAVIADFPNIIDKLVLLLNSGLTVFSALVRLSEEYDNELHMDSPMGRELAGIGRRVKNTNSSMLAEWKAFATRMESADILRFCTILEDNISKGSELSLKLENESENFQDLRKNSIQRHIRMIDSRMIMPMMAMLLSLMLVTVAPVITGF